MNIAVNLPQTHESSWQIAAGAIQYAIQTDDVGILLPRVPVMGAAFRDPKCWDGIIVRGPYKDYDVELPQVSVSSALKGDLVSATVDEDKVVQVALEQFENMGLRHLAYFGRDDWPMSHVRWGCFSRQAESMGKSPVFISGNVMEDNPIQALNHVRKPCGILAFNDELGVLLLDLCKRGGLRVPGDLHVISIGDTPVCLETTPTLSSINIPYSRIGYYAAKLCAQLIRGESVESVKVPPSGLIIRRSIKVEHDDIRSATEVAHYLRTNLSYPIQMDDVASLSPLTRRQLEKIFRATYGSSPIAYLKELRLEKAKEMLRFTNLPLKDIVNECGYTDSNHLCRAFRERVGMTPKRYREKHSNR